MMFITPGTPVYGGMVVGVSPKSGRTCRSTCAARSTSRTPAPPAPMKRCASSRPSQMSLEQCLEFLADDELLRSRQEPPSAQEHS